MRGSALVIIVIALTAFGPKVAMTNDSADHMTVTNQPWPTAGTPAINLDKHFAGALGAGFFFWLFIVATARHGSGNRGDFLKREVQDLNQEE